jgi:hypothetical protein
MANDRLKTRYDRLANSAGLQEEDRVCMFVLPDSDLRKSSILKPSWLCRYNVITQLNDIVYRNQLYPRAKTVMIYPNRVSPCLGGHSSRAALPMEQCHGS